MQIKIDIPGATAFSAVARTGSITAAAEELGLSRPTLSRRLRELEEALGLKLLHRTTRAVRLTPSGRQLLERLTPLLDELSCIQRDLTSERDVVAGELRVSVPPVLAEVTNALLATLRREHPALSTRLHTGVIPVDLRTDGVEVAIRAERLRDLDLIQRKLPRQPIGLVAAPSYLARRGAPADLESLKGHDLLLGVGAAGGLQSRWPLLGGGWVRVRGRFSSNDRHALRLAAVDGQGIALLTDVNVGPALRAGALVRVLPDVVGASLDLHIVVAHRTHQPARVRAFIDAATRRFEAPLVV